MLTHCGNTTTIARRGFYYGWVIVAACTVLLIVQAGIMYSFGVFFKPIAASFGWSRAATAGAYSIFLVSHGIFALPAGWLADRFGPAKVMTFCGFMTGLGLVLTSRVSSLWQLYVTYGLIVGIGLSGGFAVGTATTARWFVKYRGLALGIVSAGMGLGTLIMLPIAERLLAAFGWSRVYALFGVAVWVIMIASALFLRRPPGDVMQRPCGTEEGMLHRGLDQNRARQIASESGVTLRVAVRSRLLWMLILTYFLVSFCVQLVMLHFVNYATDLGISPLVAATVVSTIGIGSIVGRLAMGAASDKIGSNNALTTCLATLLPTLIWLIFARELWMFYFFAIIFGLAYGGEVPQLPVLVGQFFGLRAVAALVGAVMFGTTMGGALGSWMGGKIFDMTDSYGAAFIIAAIASLLGTMMTLVLRKQGKTPFAIA